MTVYEWGELAAQWGYPLMTGVCAMWVFICLMQWLGRRRWLDVLLALFFIIVTATFLLLSMATGSPKLLPYGQAITYVRFLWLVAALLSILYTIAFVWRRWRRWQKWTHQEMEEC